MTPLVQLSQISKAYRRGGFFSKKEIRPVLTDLDLTIHPGQWLALVGPSGAGKSTLARILLGLEAPDSGAVTVLGRPLNRQAMDRSQRRALQAVFQNALDSCNPRMTALEILAEPLVNFQGLRGRALKDRAAELLESVGLAGQGDKLPHQFSGGQLQRLCIARALAADPGLIVLDEALRGLDRATQLQILDLLEDLRQRREMAYLMITHDLELLERCTGAFLLDRGHLTPLDPLSQLETWRLSNPPAGGYNRG